VGFEGLVDALGCLRVFQVIDQQGERELRGAGAGVPSLEPGGGVVHDLVGRGERTAVHGDLGSTLGAMPLV
jgi:hypothetical protein